MNKTKHTRTTVILSVALCLVATLSFAGDRHSKKMIAHMDQNGDELISMDEFKGRQNRMFEEADSNQDGSLTIDELQAYMQVRVAEHAKEREQEHSEMQSRMAQHFAEMDTNNDQSITAEEAKSAAFNRMDKNGDGFIAADEMKRPRGHRNGKGSRQHHRDHRPDQPAEDEA